MTRILVIGDVMWDVVVRPHEPLAVGSDTPSSIAVTRGGAAANVAVALRAALTQPADVVYVGCRGADTMGERFERELERAGVVPALSIASVATGTLVSMVDERGDRTMLTDRGANAYLTPEAITAQLDDCRHVHLSGYTVLAAENRTWIADVLAECRARGVTTSVDACSWKPLTAFGPAAFLQLLAEVDVLFANRDEAGLLTDEVASNHALAVLARSFPEVVMTLGVEGALAQRGDLTATAASVAGAVLDTTGAGDAATGTYLAWRLDGHDVAPSLRAAMVAAATVVAGLGSVPFAPRS